MFFAGVVGDTLGGWLCDRIYRKTGNLALSRQSVIVASFVGALLCLLPLAVVHSTAGAALCLSGSFLCLELTIGPIWAVPSDIAPTHAGIASGMMNAARDLGDPVADPVRLSRRSHRELDGAVHRLGRDAADRHRRRAADSPGSLVGGIDAGAR